jgi:hypothetical protein
MLQAALERFGELLQIRLEKGVFTTEDAVRYTFFAALLQRGGLNPEDVIPEFRHPAIPGAQIDTWLPSFDGRGLAVEFKDDRDTPSRRNAPRTQKAGKVFHDLYRLGEVAQEMHRVFVYLTGPEMTSYFTNPINGLTEFFSLPQNRTLTVGSIFVSGRAATFVASLGAVPNIVVTALYSRSLPRHHEVRVYEVRRADQVGRTVSNQDEQAGR